MCLRLHRGASGSPVMVYNEVDDELIVIGLLMGSDSSCDDIETTSYQAMALAPALRNLEYIYSDHIKGRLQMITGPSTTSRSQSTVNDAFEGTDERFHSLANKKEESLLGSGPDTGIATMTSLPTQQ